MTGWTPDELTVLADASSLRLTAGDGPGPEVELGRAICRYLRGRSAVTFAGDLPD
jgi:hypothetical protein